MSTNFEVIPSSRLNITFGELIPRSQDNINKHLHDFGITENILLRAVLVSDDGQRLASPDENFEWPDGTYAWITVAGAFGGTDAYCSKINNPRVSPEHQWSFLHELRSTPNYQPHYDEALKNAKHHDRRWSFRRSINQPPIINLGYGIIAATLADLTDGLIYSGDGAWDYRKFPTTGAEFLSAYFHLNNDTDENTAIWEKANMAALQKNVYE